MLSKQRGDLLALNLSDRFVVRDNRENRNQSVPPELRNVVNIGVNHHPSNACSNRRQSIPANSRACAAFVAVRQPPALSGGGK